MTTTAGGITYGQAVELKTRDEGWTVEGYASTYDRDLGDDVVLPGAYKRTLSDGHKVRFLYAHQADKVLGAPITLEEDGKKGLYGRFKISRTSLGEEVRTLLLDGALDSFSIGFVPREYEHDPKTGVRRLKELELLEVSVVAMPMNPAALVTSAKAQKSLVREYLERHVAGLRAKEARLEARRRFARMPPEQVQLELAAMKLRLRLGLLGAGGR